VSSEQPSSDGSSNEDQDSTPDLLTPLLGDSAETTVVVGAPSHAEQAGRAYMFEL
jgi:hypothetical protein